MSYAYQIHKQDAAYFFQITYELKRLCAVGMPPKQVEIFVMIVCVGLTFPSMYFVSWHKQHKANLNATILTINTSNLPNGVYNYRLIIDGKVVDHNKLVIVK